MQKLLTIVSLGLMIASCNNSGDDKTTDMKTDSSSTTTQANDGWIPLFDGKTTAGWHKYGGDTVGASWKVADGNLYLDTAKKAGWQIASGGDIVTDEEYENFDLKLDWKIAKGGNSGIMFGIHEDSAKYEYPWYTGPEMQVLDNDGHDDGKIKKHRAGDLYDIISCSKETVKGPGEWNAVEIKLVNGKLDLYLNGENVVSTTMGDDNWKKLVAGSKFKSMPDFATYKKGRIGLQDHGFMVWFRNIMIKKL